MKTLDLEVHSEVLTSFLDNIIQGVVLFGADRRLLIWNKKFECALLLPKGFLEAGMSIHDIVLFLSKRGDYGEGDPDILAEKRISLLWNMENSRSEITIRNNITLDVLAQKTDNGGVIVTYTDISHLKNVEFALRDSETRFKDFAAVASDWFWEMDENLRFKYVTYSVHQHTGGIKPEDISGKTRQELDIKQDFSSEIWKNHEADLQSRRAFRNFEYSFVDDENIQRDISISGRPLFDDDGNFQGYRGVGRDISKRKKLEKSLLEQQKLLEMQVFELRDREERLEAQAAHLVSIADELSLTEEKMQFLANHDALTGLPSLRLCKDRIETAMAKSRRDGTRFALMFIDLDGFKRVNDTLGHEAGDRVLKEVAIRIQKHTREVDTVARIGGDEFVILFSGLTDRQEIIHLAERLMETLLDPFATNSKDANIGASIGIAIYPEDDQTLDGLIRCADQAMYCVKQSGKNNYRFADGL